ncbi:hypothetical protein DFH05DRAFT_1519675 [Lentinula detonsa]|uniref:Uncharacterized protein n=1 Tax=Lentinula detonsa TaxID=2804962 RepID=A0A9W8PCR2_9AGAR|nr:hypothetical protein DFH05DRAFT_1519675 [Lentinula detonsa]
MAGSISRSRPPPGRSSSTPAPSRSQSRRRTRNQTPHSFTTTGNDSDAAALSRRRRRQRGEASTANAGGYESKKISEDDETKQDDVAVEIKARVHGDLALTLLVYDLSIGLGALSVPCNAQGSIPLQPFTA